MLNKTVVGTLHEWWFKIHLCLLQIVGFKFVTCRTVITVSYNVRPCLFSEQAYNAKNTVMYPHD